jgi:hypothetical protein
MKVQKTIEQLYNGELYPSEQLNIRIDGYKEAKEILGNEEAHS